MSQSPAEKHAIHPQIQQAAQAIQQGKLHDAAQQLQMVLEEEPNHVEALAQMATIRLRTGAFDEADRLVSQALEADPENAALHHLKGIIAYHGGEYAKAVEACARGVKLSPDDPNGWNNLGEAYRELGEWQSAEEAYLKGLQLQPDHPALLANISLLYSMICQYHKAEDAAQKAAKKMPNLPAVRKAQAQCAINRMDMDAANSLLDTILQGAPNAVEALLMKADILLAEGRDGAAMELAEKALQARPQSGEAYARLAACYFTQGKFDEGMEAANKAEKWKPTSPKVQLIIANGYRTLKQYDKAQAHLDKALELAPGYVQAIAAQADVWHQTGQKEKAYGYLNDAITSYPHPQLYVGLALMHIRDRQAAQAEAAYRQALESQPDFARANLQLAKLLQLQGQYAETTMLLERVLKKTPQNADALFLQGIAYFRGEADFVKSAHFFALALYYKNDIPDGCWYLIESMRNIQLTVFAPHYAKAVEICMNNPNVSKQHLGSHWLYLLKCHSDLGQLQALLHAPDESAFIALMDGLEGRAMELTDSFWLSGLARLIVPSTEFEDFTARLRRYLLANRHLIAQNDWLPMLVALAHQHFLVEYIAETTESETAQLAELEAGMNAESPAEDIILLGCYQRVFRHELAEKWEARLRKSEDADIQSFCQFQLTEPLEEQRILPTIESLGETTDLVSQAVQSQYEENPYPRWQSATKLTPRRLDVVAKSMFPFLDSSSITIPSPAQILIPGCGTGQQIALNHNQIADSEILAVDLSRASLSYAIRRARELNINNVMFRQADILSLPEVLDQQYDYIECAGVLHHMGDPMKGMRILRKLLKPGGFMKWGLYSEIARQHVVHTRNFIKEQGFEANKAGIQACRKALRALPDDHPTRDIMHSRDFFSLSDCRDLIFHVQEKRYTLPELKAIMEELDLEFLGFDSGVTPALRQMFRDMFPEDTYSRSLDNWHEFEKKHPETFRGMYQFWMRG